MVSEQILTDLNENNEKVESPTQSLKRNEEKWTQVLMKAGWTAIPSVIIEYQHRLGLNAMELNVIMQLASYWWFKGNLPHPGKKVIAMRMNVDPSTVRRTITRLVKRGYIKRLERRVQDGRQQTNEYSFDGLIAKATEIAQEVIKEKEEQQQKKKALHVRRRRRNAA